jgi:hypothetical protein
LLPRVTWMPLPVGLCLMVGHDADKMVDLADEMKLPDGRRESCKKDFETASSSWAAVLKPYRREAGQPTVKLETIYGDGKGDLGQSKRVI